MFLDLQFFLIGHSLRLLQLQLSDVGGEAVDFDKM
jgi:hypothetical protein